MNSFEKLEPIDFTKIENKLDFKQKCLRMPVFKDEEKDELLNNNYSHLINSSIIIEESTNQSNIEENKISKNIICKESNIKIESFQTIQSSKELKNENIMIGRKRLNEQKTGRHNKYIDDNVRRKCKHIILENIKNFINNKIEIIYKGMIGQGINIKKLLILNQDKTANDSVAFNKYFLKQTIGTIYSGDITNKYTNFPKNHNKVLIQKLINEKDETKRNYFNRLFNLTFFDCLEHFRGSKNIEELEGLTKINEALKEFDDNYKQCVSQYIKNYECIINNKKPRNRSKNNINDSTFNINENIKELI
jgi:hypothetical protein